MTKLKIVKLPPTPIPDIQPNFGQLDNLHLELLENKKKLKPNLPLIPVKKVPVKVKSPQPTPDATPQATPQQSPKVVAKKPSSKTETKKPSKTETKERSSKQEVPVPSDDEEMRQLYASDNEVVDDLAEGEGEHSEAEGEVEAEEVEEDDGLTQEERDEQHRQEYLVKFRILKRANQNFKEFPEYTEFTSLSALKKMYDETFKLIQLEQNVESYKSWLQMAFFGFEIAMMKLGVKSFKGFAAFQMKKIDKYDRMLIELGERSYSNFAANWPVEVRLIGVFLFDACIFYLGKIIVDYMGGDIASVFAQMMGMDPLPQQEKKVRMRGPSMRPNDIRNMNKQ